jgi:hypothetical protein
MQSWSEQVSVWFDILAAVAFILGGANLMATHARHISDRARGWGYSVVLLVSF